MRVSALRCFGGASVPEALAADLPPLNAFATNALDDLVAVILAHVADDSGGARNATALLPAVDAFAAQHGIKNLAILSNGVRGLVSLLQACAQSAAPPADLHADALTLGLDEAHAAALEACWAAYAARTNDFHIDAQGELLRRLVDIEWKFGVTARTSTSGDTAGRTFLQLVLVLDRDGGTEHVHLELTLPQFYQFLAQMDQAKLELARAAA
ncbi:hypothetical protein M885DRAFT_613218 [Pelagophyceae sp. CCMP2097]|nr:hypothetical protein M885DRAFT_613218 [Pelagophyceae sp. CCMP2097]